MLRDVTTINDLWYLLDVCCLNIFFSILHNRERNNSRFLLRAHRLTSAIMPWKEISPGRYQRRMDGLERSFKVACEGGHTIRREHWAIILAVDVQFESPIGDKIERLKQAWKTMRYDHPTIACTVEGDVKVYEVPDQQTLDMWITSTFHVREDDDGTVDHLLATFLPTGDITLHFLPKTSQIIFHAPHWRIDGRGSFLLINNLLKAVASPRKDIKFGDEGKNLSPDLYEATGVEAVDTPEGEASATKWCMEYAQNLSGLGLHPKEAEVKPPRSTRRCILGVSSKDTSAIIAACRSRGVTVTTAFHAAVIIATKEMMMDTKSTSTSSLPKRFTTLPPMSLRHYCLPPYSTSAHPVTMYMSGVPISVDIDIDIDTPDSESNSSPLFSHLTSHIQRIYQLPWLPPSSDLIQIQDLFISKCLDIMSQPPPTDPTTGLPLMPPPSDPEVSSPGIIDHFLQHTFHDPVTESRVLEITNVWLGVEMITPQSEVYVWTWKGQMTFGVCFNEAYYEMDFMRGVLERVRRVLGRELGIDLELDVHAEGKGGRV